VPRHFGHFVKHYQRVDTFFFDLALQRRATFASFDLARNVGFSLLLARALRLQ
jgi:hypothetical protein